MKVHSVLGTSRVTFARRAEHSLAVISVIVAIIVFVFGADPTPMLGLVPIVLILAFVYRQRAAKLPDDTPKA